MVAIRQTVVLKIHLLGLMLELGIFMRSSNFVKAFMKLLVQLHWVLIIWIHFSQKAKLLCEEFA